jgi:hypothetical protein
MPLPTWTVWPAIALGGMNSLLPFPCQASPAKVVGLRHSKLTLCRWIFILEGLASVIVGGLAFWLVPDWPEDARFLTEEERRMVVHRIATDRQDASMNHWDRKTAIRVFSDVKIYLG